MGGYVEVPPKWWGTVQHIFKTIEQVPGAIDVLLAQSQKLRAAGEAYKSAHWGDSGRAPARFTAVPDPSEGVIDLGELVSVVYRTKKGQRGLLTDWEHPFEGARPVLAFCADGSGLVIVREDSKYRVTERGIEG